MSDLNSCCFTGHIVRDCEVKQVPSGTMLCVFDIAVNTGWGDNKKVLFITCNIWGARATSLSTYLLKGKNVAVTGELSRNDYVSSIGEKKCQLNLNVSGVTFLASASSNKANEGYADNKKDAFEDNSFESSNYVDGVPF